MVADPSPLAVVVAILDPVDPVAQGQEFNKETVDSIQTREEDSTINLLEDSTATKEDLTISHDQITISIKEDSIPTREEASIQIKEASTKEDSVLERVLGPSRALVPSKRHSSVELLEQPEEFWPMRLEKLSSSLLPSHSTIMDVTTIGIITGGLEMENSSARCH